MGASGQFDRGALHRSGNTPPVSSQSAACTRNIRMTILDIAYTGRILGGTKGGWTCFQHRVDRRSLGGASQWAPESSGLMHVWLDRSSRSETTKPCASS